MDKDQVGQVEGEKESHTGTTVYCDACDRWGKTLRITMRSPVTDDPNAYHVARAGIPETEIRGVLFDSTRRQIRGNGGAFDREPSQSYVDVFTVIVERYKMPNVTAGVWPEEQMAFYHMEQIINWLKFGHGDLVIETDARFTDPHANHEAAGKQSQKARH